jgi:hypothetical protein
LAGISGDSEQRFDPPGRYLFVDLKLFWYDLAS